MKNWLQYPHVTTIVLATCSVFCNAQKPSAAPQFITMPKYAVTVASSDQPGAPPQLKLERDHETVFQMPIVAGLASSSSEEQLSEFTYSLRKSGKDTFELNATAKSNLWMGRRFQWRFFPDHIEFQQFATGSGKIGRCYFLSNGVSNSWNNGTTSGHNWDTAVYADRYFAPNPNHGDQFEFNIAMPQILGFSIGREESSDQDYRPNAWPVSSRRHRSSLPSTSTEPGLASGPNPATISSSVPDRVCRA